MAGLFVGHVLVSLAVITGLSAIILAEPVMRTILLCCSAGYLGYLASRIAQLVQKLPLLRC